jgi:hypothetical protein
MLQPLVPPLGTTHHVLADHIQPGPGFTLLATGSLSGIDPNAKSPVVSQLKMLGIATTAHEMLIAIPCQPLGSNGVDPSRLP